MVLAMFNGGAYVEEQIKSILAAIGPDDELIISDDGSTDESMEVVASLVAGDARVRVVRGPGEGPARNFESALRLATGRYIFLSDQDDVWRVDKVERVVSAMEVTGGITCIVHDVEVIDATGRVIYPSYFDVRKSGPGVLRNLYKNSYLGMAMAFRSEILPLVLPIPATATMHDQWIGLNAQLVGQVQFIKDPLAQYRRHGGNVTALNTPDGPLTVVRRRVRMVSLVLRQIAGRRMSSSTAAAERGVSHS